MFLFWYKSLLWCHLLTRYKVVSKKRYFKVTAYYAVYKCVGINVDFRGKYSSLHSEMEEFPLFMSRSPHGFTNCVLLGSVRYLRNVHVPLGRVFFLFLFCPLWLSICDPDSSYSGQYSPPCLRLTLVNVRIRR